MNRYKIGALLCLSLPLIAVAKDASESVSDTSPQVQTEEGGRSAMPTWPPHPNDLVSAQEKERFQKDQQILASEYEKIFASRLMSDGAISWNRFTFQDPSGPRVARRLDPNSAIAVKLRVLDSQIQAALVEMDADGSTPEMREQGLMKMKEILSNLNGAHAFEEAEFHSYMRLKALLTIAKIRIPDFTKIERARRWLSLVKDVKITTADIRNDMMDIAEAALTSIVPDVQMTALRMLNTALTTGSGQSVSQRSRALTIIQQALIEKRISSDPLKALALDSVASFRALGYDPIEKQRLQTLIALLEADSTPDGTMKSQIYTQLIEKSLHSSTVDQQREILRHYNEALNNHVADKKQVDHLTSMLEVLAVLDPVDARINIDKNVALARTIRLAEGSIRKRAAKLFFMQLDRAESRATKSATLEVFQSRMMNELSGDSWPNHINLPETSLGNQQFALIALAALAHIDPKRDEAHRQKVELLSKALAAKSPIVQRVASQIMASEAEVLISNLSWPAPSPAAPEYRGDQSRRRRLSTILNTLTVSLRKRSMNDDIRRGDAFDSWIDLLGDLSLTQHIENKDLGELLAELMRLGSAQQQQAVRSIFARHIEAGRIDCGILLRQIK